MMLQRGRWLSSSRLPAPTIAKASNRPEREEEEKRRKNKFFVFVLLILRNCSWEQETTFCSFLFMFQIYYQEQKK